jgi:hypothetical protein
MRDPSTMNSDHPANERLLAMLEQGLPEAESDAIMKHLDNCPVCEGRVEKLERCFDVYRRYRDEAWRRTPQLDPWPDLWQAMARADAESRTITIRKRVRPAWMGAIAAGLVLSAFVLWPAGRGAEARAEVLLLKARQSAPAHVANKRVRIKTTTGCFIRPAVLRGQVALDAQADSVRAEFEAARYNWDDPLNPDSYRQWRDGLQSRSVRVTEDRNSAVVETSASVGRLREASLMIEVPRMLVVGANFQFADRERVEITMMPEGGEDSSPPSPSVSRSTIASEKATELHDVTPQVVEIPLAERELRVWAAIDALSAPIGTPITIDMESAGRIVVTAYSLGAQQQAELRSSLDGIPNLTLHFQDGAESAVRLERTSTGDIAIDISESIAARAHRIAQLAEHFPREIEASLSPVDQIALRNMRLRHASQMNRDIEALRARLAQTRPIAFSVNRDANAGAPEEIVSAANIVDRLVTSLSADAGVAVASWPQLGEQLSRLHRAAQIYLRSLENPR